MISHIVISICGFVWTILIARYLGVNDYGILGFAISLTGLISFTMDWGINTYIVRHVSTDYDSTPKYIGNAIPLKGIFSIFSFLLTLVILVLMKSDELTITITLLFLIEMIIKSILDLMNGCFQAYEKGKYQGIANIIVNLILLVFLLISIFSDFGIYGIAISYIVANIIGLIYAYYILNKHIAKPRFEFDKAFCKKITLLSFPFAIGGILYGIYYSIDIIMLTNLIGSYATGIYNATYKLIGVLTLFYSIYTAVIFPIMSKFYKNDKQLLLISFEKSIKYLLLVIVPMAIATTLYSSDIIQLIYGHQYDNASSVLSILIWTVCLLFISGACNSLLNASYKEVSVAKIYLIAAVFNIVLNFFMIPHYSYDGAAITTVLSDALIVIIQSYLIYKLGHRPGKKLYFDIGKILVGSAILGIALHFLKLNMWVALPVGIIIYLTGLYLLRLFDDDDKYVIEEILGKN
jgi:O-antigen/teichoic acid export membrane protein